ncbi:MAG: 16S rRNA (adenine(1518)-N(6)/adenine(1519)-N(6))-dimethyltransferase RsmA [Candidatus Peribacteraceae bacterium]
MLRDEVRSFLRRHKLRLDTDAGQHFLVDGEALAEIIAAANLQASDRIVEIGPGIGILTRELLGRVSQITAIEIDPRLIPLLHRFVEQTPSLKPKTLNLTAIHGNALHTPMPAEAYKVVANIPYHITSPLLHHILLESDHAPVSLTLLIQREVAENICAEKSASILTILVRLFGEPRLVRLVHPEAFLPPPEVDSAVLSIECFEKPLVNRETAYRILGLAKLAFSRRRKMLSNSIGKTPGGPEALALTGIQATRRPETLTVGEWIALAAALYPISAS